MADFSRQLLNCWNLLPVRKVTGGPAFVPRRCVWLLVFASLGPVKTVLAQTLDPAAVVLGAEELFRGIPGEGPLTTPQIERWLDDPRNHDPLEPLLPWHLKEAQDQVAVPPDNPLTKAKIELGRQLFF